MVFSSYFVLCLHGALVLDDSCYRVPWPWPVCACLSCRVPYGCMLRDNFVVLVYNADVLVFVMSCSTQRLVCTMHNFLVNQERVVRTLGSLLVFQRYNEMCYHAAQFARTNSA
jgi:hypothetical protein